MLHKRRTVLIADDNAQWREIIARILQPEYAVVGFAERGDELLARAAALHPDVITLDVSMPGRSGLAVLPELRRALPGAVLIILTTTSNKLYRDEADHRGADGYVLKNRALHELVPAIHLHERSWIGNP
jgi:two-component system, NarL family, response regulator DesR